MQKRLFRSSLHSVFVDTVNENFPSKVRKVRKAGIVVFMYLDHIIVLGPSRERLYVHRPTVLRDLVASGLTINFIKSLLSPTQQFEALGLEVNLKDGYLMVPMHKRKGYRKEAGKLLTNVHMTPRKMAAILGRFRSLLPALPALTAFTDLLVTFVGKHRMLGWDTACPIPFNLKEQVRSMKNFLLSWPSNPFSGNVHQHTRALGSDSTSFAWGGLDTQSKAVVHDFWRLDESHINLKKLQASIHTIMSLAPPKSLVHLDVDNSVAFSYLTKHGGKIGKLNAILRPFLLWMNRNQVTLVPRLVPSKDMLADGISRWRFDPGEYSVKLQVFVTLMGIFRPHCTAHIDMFASPSNVRLPLFCACWPHHQAHLVDALSTDLTSLTHVYAHPPWSIIDKWLHRLRVHPNL